MGQRMQIFVIVPNFTKELTAEVKQWDKKENKAQIGQHIAQVVKQKKELADYKAAYGDGIARTTKYKKYKKDLKSKKLKTVKYKACVVAYHHQWLYGRSALLAASNVLRMCNHSSTEDSPFHPENYYAKGAPLEMINNLTMLLSVFNDPILNSSRHGFERFTLLNTTEPEMGEDFTGGDNNDGIFIIDAIENKYCFMNIHETYSPGQLSLPYMKPLTAEEYVESYYTSKKESLALYEPNMQDDNTPDPDMIPGGDWYEKHFSDAVLEENRIENAKYLERFNGFELMTVEEVKQMFPKVKWPGEKVEAEAEVV